MEEEGEASGGGGKKILILILLLAIGAAAYYFLKPEEEEAPQEEVILREGPPPIDDPQYMPLGTFVVNLTDGKYFLKTTITLVFAEEQPRTWLQPWLPLVKDMVISQLSTLSSKQLRDARVRELLRKELQIRVNSLFPNMAPWEDRRPVKRILFEEFYTQ